MFGRPSSQEKLRAGPWTFPSLETLSGRASADANAKLFCGVVLFSFLLWCRSSLTGLLAAWVTQLFLSGKVSALGSGRRGWHVSRLRLVTEISWAGEVTSACDRRERYGAQAFGSSLWPCDSVRFSAGRSEGQRLFCRSWGATQSWREPSCNEQWSVNLTY